MRKWIGVDLDGTLALNKGNSISEIGDPIPSMIKHVKQALELNEMDVRIFTARVSCAEPERSFQIALIGAWCKEHLGQVLPVTCCKDFDMFELWDDRAVGVERNTGLFLSRPKYMLINPNIKSEK